jgi:16S rRNA G966 N2-methylase RsmD
MIESNAINNNIPLRFSDWVLKESKMLIESKNDPQCPDYSRFVVVKESEYSCLMPYQAKQVGDIIEAHFGGRENINDILDATAHIGCDTINFRTRFGANCISLEMDQDAHACLVQNQQAFTDTKDTKDQSIEEKLDKQSESLQIYYPDNNFSVHCNCIEFITGFKKTMDFVYFDPPWGGPDYWKQKNIMLFLEHKGREYPLYTVVTRVFKEGFCKTVVVKTPNNFNMHTFRQRLGACVKCQSYMVMKPKKDGVRSTQPVFLITICTLI